MGREKTIMTAECGSVSETVGGSACRSGRRTSVDAVLFDLDGTLLDTTQAIVSSLTYTVEKLTGRTPDPAELQPYMGLPLIRTFSDLVPGRAEEACEVYVRHNVAVHKDLVRPYPGVPETVTTLLKRGVRLALVTSKRRTTTMIGLEIAGLTESFEAMVCFGETEKAKPDPEPVLKALELLVLDKRDGAEILVVGDSPWDIRAARSAARLLPRLHVRSAAVTYGIATRQVLEQEHPDHFLDAISDVLALCL